MRHPNQMPDRRSKEMALSEKYEKWVLKSYHTIMLFILFIAIASFTFQSHAAVPPQRSLDQVLAAQKDIHDDIITQKQMAEYIPTDMKPTNDSQQVARRIADKSVGTILNSPEVKNSSVGQAAKTAQEKMQTDVSFGGDEPNSIKHNVKMQMLAFQNMARIDYSGYVDATFKYHLYDPTSDLEIYEKIGRRDLVFNHIQDTTEVRNQVSLRWNW